MIIPAAVHEYAPCPVCGGRDLRIRNRSLLSAWVRAECECGVAGQWQKVDEGHSAVTPALRGWQKLTGKPKPSGRK